jgi:predicted lipid-binding transport protein (Tim44 family)
MITLFFAILSAFIFYTLFTKLGEDQIIQAAPKKSTVNTEFWKISVLDPLCEETSLNFNALNFLKGATRAFESILKAYNRHDHSGLKKLTTDDVYNNFAPAMTGTKNLLNSVSIASVEVLGAHFDDNCISITLKFISHQSFADKPDQTQCNQEDIWTFTKDRQSSKAPWLLSETA